MWHRVSLAIILGALLASGQTLPATETPGYSQDSTVRWLLALVRSFRTVYVEQVMDHLQRAGVGSHEYWEDDDHAVMLPFQFVKRAGLQIKKDVGTIEIGLISMTPLYSSNFPRTAVELEALKELMAHPEKGIHTFSDGPEFKGLAADIAIHKSCVDCHNHHRNAVRDDFKLGDPMGAVIVRLKS